MKPHLGSRAPAAPRRSLWRTVGRQRWLLFMLLPALLFAAVFSYLPLAGWAMAFTDYRLGGGLFSGEFTGLLQFRRLFVDTSDLGYLLRNTLVMSLGSMLLGITVSLAFSLLLNEIGSRLGKRLMQTVSFFPFFISWVIAYSVLNALFAVQSGAVNQLMVGLGLWERGKNFLGSPAYSWPLIILVNLWKNLGYNSVIFLSALGAIPQEQYEAAAIDGAGRFARVRLITLPSLLPTATMLLVLNSGFLLNSNLEQFFIFTNSTNWETMEVLDMYIYKFGMKLLDYPYATAVGMLKTLVSIGLFLLINRLARRFGGRSPL